MKNKNTKKKVLLPGRKKRSGAPKKITANKICKTIHAKCPYCFKRLDLSDFATEFFQRVLLYLRDHERLVISNFGAFHMRRKSAQTGMVAGKLYNIRAYRYVSFSTATAAKKFLKGLPIDDR